jgi:hypothetical protein
MNPEDFLSQEQAPLRRIEITLIDHVSELDLILEVLYETQEHLVIVQDYLKKTSASFIALSHFGFIESHLARQRREILNLLDITREVLNFVRQLKASREKARAFT